MTTATHRTASSAHTTTEPKSYSCGQLLDITPQFTRIEIIAAMNPRQRHELAHLAAFGTRKYLNEAKVHYDRGRLGFAGEAMDRAAQFAELVVELT